MEEDGCVKTKEEETIYSNFLLSAADCVKNISSNTLRSHLNILCGNVLRMKFDISKWQMEKLCCQFCHALWRQGLFSVKVLPVARKGKKMRKILRKIAENKRLAPKQKQLAEAAHFGNTVLVKCLVCQKATNFEVSKDIPVKVPVQVETAVTATNKKKKKKKKKNNKFYGLNPEVMKQYCCSDNMLQQDSIKSSFNNNHGDDNVIYIGDNDEVNLGSRKRKIGSSSSADLCEIETRNQFKKKKIEKIRANPLPITPLGLPHAPPAENIGSNFLPLTNVNNAALNAKNTKTHKMKKTPGNVAKRDIVVNPFSNKGQKHLNAQKSKKLSRWKKLIAAEEEKPIKSCSLQDFLSAL